MSRKQHPMNKQLAVVAALALGVSGIAMAEDKSTSTLGGDGYAENSMSRLGGDGYAYFNQPVRGNTPASPAWRQSHPNGPTERELQAAASSSLAAFTFPLDNPNPVFASAPADPSWRKSHPFGLTEGEMQAVASSSLAMWQIANGSAAASAPSNVVQGRSKVTSLARGDTKVGTNPPSWTFGE